MQIKTIKIHNFRLLKDSVLEMKNDLSLLIGRNNSGKTSLFVLFEKFYNDEKFTYDDFSLSLREQLHSISNTTNILDLSIQMILEISYDETDNLEKLSEFILDLDPEQNMVKILFEASIKKEQILPILESLNEPAKKIRYIKKNLQNFLTTTIYSFEDDDDLLEANRYKLIKKDLKQIKNLINFQIIHAKRNVSSSDDNKGKKILSIMSTKYFNQKNINEPTRFSNINQTMVEMDESLNDIYSEEFDDFLEYGKDFLGIETLKVVSDLESNEVLQSSSKVIYGDSTNHLPEHLNGLGFMNILYLLLDIKMKKENFNNEAKDINLLFIEEPEAHTHPQMQYKFIDKIKKVFSEIDNLHTVITTHSAQIVSRCDFKDIRYLLNVNNENIKIKNFHSELKSQYGTEEEEFKFVEQYLTLQASELFFANKIIFIEGTTEKMLLPYYINKFDNQMKNKVSLRMQALRWTSTAISMTLKHYEYQYNKFFKNNNYIPLSSQNISILEVGANAKAFNKLIQFLDIQTLIITDIDTTKKNASNNYEACEVEGSTHTSNATIKYFLNAPADINSTDFTTWFTTLTDATINNLVNQKIKISYQIKEENYHPRSFEDAFLKINLDLIKANRNDINGLQNKDDLDTIENIYELTERILKKKSDFAFSLLYLALSKNIDWQMPLYIKNALEWIQNDAS